MQLDIVRLWKNEEYRESLSEKQLATLPTSPIGEIELNDAELQMIQGGQANSNVSSAYGGNYDAGCGNDNGDSACGNYGYGFIGFNTGSCGAPTSCSSQSVGYITTVRVIPTTTCYTTYSSCD